jgi:myo-inositol-1(or 4)-monophosphatase
MDWKFFCDRLTDAIWIAIKDKVGTEEAATKVARDKKNTKKIDALAEDTVIDYLKKENMDVTLLSEEIGEIQIGGSPKYAVVLDPVDGTTNAIKGLPFFSTSIAIANGKRIEDLVVGYIRNYLTGEVFYADESGAFQNDKKCASSSCNVLRKALISIYTYNNVDYRVLRRILMKIGKMRLFGAISLELAYVACNRLDGIIDLRGDLKISDIAASILLLEKAGGICSDMDGNEFMGNLDMNEKYTIVAGGNQVLYDEFMRILDLEFGPSDNKLFLDKKQ